MESHVIDLETTTRCPVGTNKANPMWLGNKIVAVGINTLTQSHYSVVTDYKKEGLITRWSDNPNVLLIGANIKFDLLYLWRDARNSKLPYIWDIQLAEYLLTGQEVRYPSLDDMTRKYVGEYAVKDAHIKAYWESGVDTSDIPEDELRDYLRNDVTNTRLIYDEQIKEVNKRGAMPFFVAQMEALRATTAMNLAGMAIDWHYIDKQKAHYNEVIAELLTTLPPELREEDAWASPKQLSRYFFGGEEKYPVKESVGFYKNGKEKFKLMDRVRVHPPKINASTLDLEPSKAGYYSTDDSVLDLIAEKSTADLAYTAYTIKQLRVASKVLNTYYEGLSSLRFPDNFIYPQLNHVSTATGRLSCTSPNLQNQTDVGDVKRAFISRHGAEGRILELDYSQLEMVWLAYIANDYQLIYDINHGIDMHTVLFEKMYGRTPSKAERKAFKPRSFQLVYGAGPKAIAEQGKIPVDEAKQFIKVFYDRYKGVESFHKNILKEADTNKVVKYSTKEPGVQYKYERTMPWGRKYVFNSYYVDWKKEHAISPTELKNYLVQGSATGDMVPTIVGILQRRLEESGYNAKLVMTVHDSIVIDTHVDCLYNVAALAKEVMESAPTILKNLFNIDFPCKLGVGVEAGLNWQDKTELAL